MIEEWGEMLQNSDVSDEAVEDNCSTSGTKFYIKPKTTKEYDQENNKMESNSELKYKLQAKEKHIRSIQENLDDKENQIKHLQKELEIALKREEAIKNEMTECKHKLQEKIQTTENQFEEIKVLQTKLVELKRKCCEMESKANSTNKIAQKVKNSQQFQDLGHQLSLSEDNVRRLVKVLEDKDKMLGILLKKERPAQMNKKSDVAKQKLLENKEKELEELKMQLAKSESKLNKARRVVEELRESMIRQMENGKHCEKMKRPITDFSGDNGIPSSISKFLDLSGVGYNDDICSHPSSDMEVIIPKCKNSYLKLSLDEVSDLKLQSEKLFEALKEPQ